MKLILFFLFVSIILESTIITLPLTLLIILYAAVIFKNHDVIVLAFFSGLFLDILTLGTIGVSSLYFVIFVMLIVLYQKKFEIQSLNYILLTSIIGSSGYLFITGSNHVVLEVLFSTILITGSFFIFKKTNKKARSYSSG